MSNSEHPSAAKFTEAEAAAHADTLLTDAIGALGSNVWYQDARDRYGIALTEDSLVPFDQGKTSYMVRRKNDSVRFYITEMSDNGDVEKVGVVSRANPESANPVLQRTRILYVSYTGDPQNDIRGFNDQVAVQGIRETILNLRNNQ